MNAKRARLSDSGVAGNERRVISRANVRAPLETVTRYFPAIKQTALLTSSALIRGRGQGRLSDERLIRSYRNNVVNQSGTSFRAACQSRNRALAISLAGEAIIGKYATLIEPPPPPTPSLRRPTGPVISASGVDRARFRALIAPADRRHVTRR